LTLCFRLPLPLPPPHLPSFPTRRSSDLPPLAARLEHQMESILLEIADAAVNEPRGMRGRARAEVRFADERGAEPAQGRVARDSRDRKSTRLNSSHDQISYAVFCLKKKKK